MNESEGAAAGAGVPGPGVRVHGEAEGAPEAPGREHTSQRLFPDKLPESLEEGLKAPECASGMYKETVYSAFSLLMHYPLASGAGQRLQSQPPLVSDPSSQAQSRTGYFLACADEAWMKKGLLPRLRIPRCPFPVHTQWSLTQKENSGVPGLHSPRLLLAFALPACPCRCLLWTVLGLGDRDLLKTVWS